MVYWIFYITMMVVQLLTGSANNSYKEAENASVIQESVCEIFVVNPKLEDDCRL